VRGDGKQRSAAVQMAQSERGRGHARRA
jgi:hypothetical protein